MSGIGASGTVPQQPAGTGGKGGAQAQPAQNRFNQLAGATGNATGGTPMSGIGAFTSALGGVKSGGGQMGQQVTNQLAGGGPDVGGIGTIDAGPRVAASGAPAAPSQPPNMYEQAANAINQSLAGAQAEMGYQPMEVRPYVMGMGPSQYGATQAGPSNVGAQEISQFFNPYESQVVGSALGDIERARQMQANQLGAQAQSAGAFGGSRQAIMESELGRNALQQAAQTASGLRQQGYGQALGAAMSQADRLQQARLANMAAENQARQFNAGQRSDLQRFRAGQRMQADLANQQAQLAGSGQRLAAGQQAAGIGNLGFGQMNTLNNQAFNQGMYQQMQIQNLLNSANQQFGLYQNAPQQSLQNLLAAVSGVPAPSSTTQTGSPGLLDIGTSVALMASLFPSDRRLKKNIERIGELDNGLGWYKWEWNDEGKKVGAGDYPSVGVIAQEAQEIIPDAVIKSANGYLMVDYGKVL